MIEVACSERRSEGGDVAASGAESAEKVLRARHVGVLGSGERVEGGNLTLSVSLVGIDVWAGATCARSAASVDALPVACDAGDETCITATAAENSAEERSG